MKTYHVAQDGKFRISFLAFREIAVCLVLEIGVFLVEDLGVYKIILRCLE